MTSSADTDARSSNLLSVISISDYEVLIAPRGAFVDFLLGPYAAEKRASAAGTSSSAV